MHCSFGRPDPGSVLILCTISFCTRYFSRQQTGWFVIGISNDTVWSVRFLMRTAERINESSLRTVVRASRFPRIPTTCLRLATTFNHHHLLLCLFVILPPEECHFLMKDLVNISDSAVDELLQAYRCRDGSFILPLEGWHKLSKRDRERLAQKLRYAS